MTMDSDEAEVILVDVKFENGLLSSSIDMQSYTARRVLQRWTTQQARTRALQEVKAALVDVWRSQQFALPLTEIIRRRKEKSVLILGSFKESGRKRLDRTKQYLLDKGYLPVLVDEYPDVEDQSLAQKVATMGLASRFVIAEDSEAAGQLYEIGAVCQKNDLLTIIVREEGCQASFMMRGASVVSKIIAEYDYKNSALEATLDTAVEWAERTFAGLGQAYRSTYPWRDVGC
jgi:hypothetical protein